MTNSAAKPRPSNATTIILLLCSSLSLLAAAAPAAAQEISSRRVAEIAGWLSEKPAGFGVPVGNRRSWGPLAANKSFAGEISDAERLLSEPIPEQSDDLYLDFSRTGNRTRWQKVSGQRRGRVPTLTIAECIENKGRFVSAFEEIVRVLCSERTWVMPAHDAKLTNFRGETVDIDLGSSALGWSLATADYLLADKLSPEIRRLIAENLESRIFQPYRDMVLGKRQKNWWMTGTNNWNAVCLAGVTGAALAAIDSRDDRAFFIAAAEHYSKYFLEGFTDDGYCSEGLGYWNYGFGHYVMLNEMIRQATGGKIDLLQDPKARQAATFGSKIEIINGVYPAFADCSISAEPGSRLMYYVSRSLGLGLSGWEQIDPVSAGGSLYESMMYSFPNAASQTPPVLGNSEGPGTRSWFDQAGILICRPAAGSACRLGAALKGGHNDEHHNHNDVGSFVVVLGNKALLLDPGGEVYTARTFSSHRYESNVLNSFGHPVPLVAGKLQKTGSQARARVVGHRFTEDTDVLILDIASAYDVPELKKLERTFVYSRAGAGSLTVTDEVAFSKPCDFGTALVTFEKWQQSRDLSLRITDDKDALRASITTTGAEFKIEPEVIHEDLSAHKEPTRLGINLTQPVMSAVVRVTITPEK